MTRPDPIPDLSTAEAQHEEWLYWLASTRQSIRQIRRWVGWLVAIAIATIVLEFASGALIAIIEALEDPAPGVIPSQP